VVEFLSADVRRLPDEESDPMAPREQRHAPLPSRIPILCYHSVSNVAEGAIAPFAVRPDDLARHLDLVVSGGCSPRTVSDFVAMLEQDQPIEPGTVLITFDDGYEDTLTVVAPMLAARRLPATVFVTTGYLPGSPGGTVADVPGAMIDWHHLVDLEAAGIEVGCHAHTHRALDVLPRTQARYEIRRSKDLVEAALGHPVASFAYPYGYASRWVQDEVRRCGFGSGCGVRNAFSHAGDNRWLMARLMLTATTTRDDVERWLVGSGAPLASRREHLTTKAWRAVRRARALGGTVSRSGAGSRHPG
jgi:peptidoglycan/xylan/chitin deacetylase (PgdA/CDA1 family)